MRNDLTTYQIYLMLLGYLTERHDNTQMLESMLVELYRRASKADLACESEENNGEKRSNLSIS
jgi:hypothetical protein